MEPKNSKPVLIAGWFSFDLPHNTAGDLLAKQTAITWTQEAGFDYRIAMTNPSSPNEVPTNALHPEDYYAVVFVCGPLTERHILPFIQPFSGIKRIALNVSIVETSDLSNEFDVIIPRDTNTETNPDISLATSSVPVPVIGLIYVGKQREYPTQKHEEVEELVSKAVNRLGAATVMIDTRLPHNQYGLSSIDQIESTIRHMDIVITTRLHGAVLSLRNGTPPVVIDSVPEGAKVTRQMEALDWPLRHTIADLSEAQLITSINSALTQASHDLALKVANMAEKKLQKLRDSYILSLKKAAK